MTAKKQIFVFLSFFTLFLLVSASETYAQQPLLQKKISGSFTDVPIVNVLRKIASQNNLKFSYNPVLIQPSRRISIRFTNQPLGEVLKLILNDASISYKELGNQIVLYRSGDPPAKTEITQVVSPDKIQPNSKKNPDTVYVYRVDTLMLNRVDTVFRSISITRFDTIRIYDTVFRDKIKTQKASPAKKNPFGNNSMKHRKYLKNNGFYSSIYVEWLPANLNFKSDSNIEYLDLTKSANSSQLANFEVGTMVGYDYFKIGLRSGIGISRVGEQFSFSYIDEQGGFFKKDSVEKYYLEPVGTDTTWIWIFDSTWIPKTSTSYNYFNFNTYHYLNIPLSVKFRFIQNEKYDIYAFGGIRAQFLLSAKALYMLPQEKYKADWIQNKNLQPLLLNWQIGVGTALKFSDTFGLLAETSYNNQLTNQYVDIPVKKYYKLIGVKVGAYIKF